MEGKKGDQKKERGIWNQGKLSKHRKKNWKIKKGTREGKKRLKRKKEKLNLKK